MPPIGGADEILKVFIGIETNAGVQLRQVGQQIDGFARKTNRQVGLATKAFKGFGTAIGGVTGRLASFARRYAAIGGSIAGAAVLFKSVADAQKFGIAIAEIQTIFEGTDEELQRVTRSVLELAEALGVNESLVAKGFYQIISADITGAADAMLVLEEGTKLATVGLADVKTTIDVLTSVIKAYQLPVEEAANITNVLFRAVIKGKTTIPELGHSLGQVLPIAAALNIELEDVAAALATLTQGGIETNTAVIQMRQVFNQLLKPSAEALEVMQNLGLQLDVIDIRGESLEDTLRKVEEGVGDNASAMAKLFGNVRALIPILALAGKQADQFRSVLKFIGEDSSKVEEALARFLETPFKKFQRFFNSLRLELRKIGEVFIREFTNQIDKQGGIDKVVDDISAAFGSIEAAARVAAQAMGGVIQQVQFVIEKLGGVERARKIFEQIGAIISQALNVVFQDFVALITVAVLLLAQMPALVQAISFEFKQLANDVARGFINSPLGAGTRAKAFAKGQGIDDIVPFPEIVGLKDQQELLEEVERIQARASEIEQMFGGSIFGEIDPALGKTAAEVEALRTEFRLLSVQLVTAERAMASAAPDLEALVLNAKDITTALGPTSDAITGVGDAWKALVALFNGETADTGGEWLPGQIQEWIEGLPNLVDAAKFKLAEIAAVELEAHFDRLAVQAALFDTLGSLQDLATATGIEVPVEFAKLSFEEVSTESIKEFIALIESTGNLPNTIVPFGTTLDEYVASAEKIKLSFANALELIDMQKAALADLPDTEVERARIVENMAGLYREQLEAILRTKGATTEFRNEMLRLFDLQTDQKVSDLIGFKDFETEFEKASRGLTDTLERQRTALDKNQNAIIKRTEKLRAMGRITSEEVALIQDVLTRAVEQFDEKVRSAEFGQSAFQGITDAARSFEDMEMAAKAAALAVTGIGVAANEAEFQTLRDEFNRQMDRMRNDAGSFKESFSDTWADLVKDMVDQTRIGAQVSADILNGLNDAFASTLSSFIQGDEKAFEAFKELFAKSIADSLAQALSDVFVGTFADVLAGIFGDKVKEKLIESATEAGAEAALGGPAGVQAAITGAGGAAVGAAGAAAQGAAGAASEGAAIATAIAATLSTEMIPVVTSLTTAGGLLEGASFSLGTTAAGALGAAAGALVAAAEAIVAASTVNNATGGILPNGTGQPIVKPYAFGGITGAVENLAVGGIRTRETFARIAEAGMPEAVVPLPGDGRSIPVKFQGGGGAGMGRGDTHVETHVTFVVQDSDGSMRGQIAQHSRQIEGIIERALINGTNRGLKMATRRAANG